MRDLLTVLFVSTFFFLSGGCGLVYESLWTRYIAELTGGTALSQLIVLMVFMGGLALGAIMVGRLVDRQPGQGLVIYGALEIGIGLYALLFPHLHSMFAQLYYTFGSNMESGSAALMILKILLSFLLIITPSVAMGGTLPAVSRYLTMSHQGLRGNIGLLYGINSLGAVTGILAAGFFLVYRYGMAATMQYTGAFNLIIGLAALTYALFKTSAKASCNEKNHSKGYSEEILDSLIYEPAEVRRALIIAGLSGFAAMALQVAWIRYFVIFLGATHSSFTIVVAAFVFGIGLGSLLVKTKIVGRIPLPKVLVGLLLLITTTLWVELFFYERIPFEISRFLGIIARTPFSWPFYSVIKFGILFFLMLLFTLASGIILPVCIRIAERGSKQIGRDVAKVYAVNTISALLGILVTGQLLFRVFNLPRTLQIIMFVYLAATIFLAFSSDDRTRKCVLAYVTVLIATHLVFWQPWSSEKLFVRQIEFGQTPPLSYRDFAQRNEDKTVIKDLHGPDAHVTVIESTFNKNNYQAMYINGKPDASTDTDMPVQILTGQIPVLLHPKPDSVFVLGLGSGITSSEILKFQEVKEVITAELATEVFEASKTFADYNDRFWENPRHKMAIEDGVTFLRLSSQKFDVIALEPTNVWQAGMSGLFSEDFFQIVKSKLKPGGIAAQWLHTYMIDDLTVNLVLKTFSRVFPNSSIFILDQVNIILIGYDEQWQFDPQNFEHRFNQPQILESQKKAGNVNAGALLLRELLSRQSFHEYTKVLALPINTLNFPILEQTAEYARFIQKPSKLLQGLDSRLDLDVGDMLFHEYTKQVGFDLNQNRAVIESSLLDDNFKLRESLNFMLLDKLWTDDQPSPPLEALSHIYDAQMREIVMHPNYRKSSDQLTTNDAYNLFGAELLVWNKAVSQIWKPNPDRLHHLYDRIIRDVDQDTAGMIARKAGFSLALSRACRTALPFFKIAESKGKFTREMLTPNEIAIVFHCEVKEGTAEKANHWWKIMKEKDTKQAAAMEADKATLDIKLGEDPPPVIYGRLPKRW